MKDRLQWFGKHKILTGILVLVIIVIAAPKSTKNDSQSTNSPAPQAKQSIAVKAQPVAKPAERQVSGEAKTLGAGTFTGGTDIVVGLYDVTPGAGESGNFIVSGTDSYNEILGSAASLGVPKVRVQISVGDKIEISSLSQVVFTPVTAPFVTTHTTATLYAGTFIVGQDVGAGRYIATPGAGQSGNFIVSGNDSYNEILGGGSDLGGVPQVTVTLTKGDVVDISGLSQVTLTAQ